MKPTIKRRWLIPTLLSLSLPLPPISFGVAHARQATDAPLPPISPRELAARIREARNPYDDQGVFEATFDEVRDTNWKFARNQGNAEEQKPILVIFHGLVRFASNGLQWRAEHDGKAPNALSARLTPEHWISGFDGSQTYDWRVSDRRVILHETHDNPRLWSPRNLFWEQADALIDALEQQGPARIPIAIRAEVVDGQACYVVEAGKAGEGLWTRHVLSPSRGCLPIRRVQQRDGKTFMTYDLHDLREVVPGIWAPGRIEYEWLNVRKDGASRPFIRRSIRVVDYRPRGLVDPVLLALELPYDVRVTDPRLGYTYHNDPWWPEVGPLLLSRFDWPRTDLSPLGKLALAPARPPGNPARPPVRFGSWVQTRFPHFAALTDKVVLLVFDDGTSQSRLELAPALKRIDSAYHSAGLEIIAIAPPGVDIQELKQAVPAYEIKYAVAVDAPGPDGRGQTAAVLGVEQFPAAIVIDRQGNVRAPEGGRLVDTMLLLLAQADGPQALRRLSLEPPRMPQQAYNIVTRMFEQEVAKALAADPHGEIICRVVDSRGQAVAGATVSARLGLTILPNSGWNASWSTYYGAPPGTTGSTGPDGQVVIRKRCKGTYTVRVEASGKAWAERKVSVGPQLDPASIEIVLPDGYAIAGQIVDEDGQPFPGARIAADEWEHTEDTMTFFNSCEWLKPVTADAGGRFRFADLPSGYYTFQVTAPGFVKQELKRIATGKEKLSITLKRSE